VRTAIISQFAYPHAEEIRLKKISETLAADGHEVHVLSRWEPDLPAVSPVDNLTIHRIRLLPAVPALNAVLTLHLAYNPVWLGWIWWKCRALGIDVIIVRNLRLAPPSILAGRLLCIPVITDLSENFPALAEIQGRAKLQDYFTRTPAIERFFERFTVRWAGHVWAVAEENRQRLITDYDADPERISVLGNVPTAEVSASLLDYKDRQVDHVVGSLTLVFLGIVDELRGLDKIVEAIARANADSSEGEFRLIVIGDGPARRDLEDLADRQGVSDKVQFTGWIDSDKRYAYLMEGDVGIVPHVDCELCQTTIPNKLFDYMAAGLPVLTTDLKPVREIVRNSNCGFVIASDPCDIADQLRSIAALDHEDLRRRGEAGRQAVQTHYNWACEEPEIRRTLTSVTAGDQ
jgi:glycosyltransferase involved in cell wall biosynthesis